MVENKASRLFYGYVVVLAAFFITLIVEGIFYSFGVFFQPVLTEFGWTRAATSGAYSLCVMIVGLLSIGTGRMNDRFGPRVLLTGCGLFLGLGYLLMSRIGAIWQLYLVYGVIVALGMSAYLAPLMSTVVRWFVRRRALMSGVALSGVGLGMIVIPPLVSRLIATYDWRTCYVIAGVTAFVLIIIGAQFLKRDPGKIGTVSYGQDKAQGEGLDLQARGISLRKATQYRQFWLLCVFCFSFFLCVSTILVHIVIHATGLGIPALAAANILAFIGGASIVGRVTIGGLADRIGNKRCLVICFALLSVALLWLMTVDKVWMFNVFAIIFGIGYGGIAALKSPVTADLFGLSAHGAILGVTYFSDSVGGLVGPVLAGLIFDMTGSYRWAFLFAAAIAIIGLTASSLLRPVGDRQLQPS